MGSIPIVRSDLVLESDSGIGVRAGLLGRAYPPGYGVQILRFPLYGPVVQQDKTSDYGSENWGFKSLRDYCRVGCMRNLISEARALLDALQFASVRDAKKHGFRGARFHKYVQAASNRKWRKWAKKDPEGAPLKRPMGGGKGAGIHTGGGSHYVGQDVAGKKQFIPTRR